MATIIAGRLQLQHDAEAAVEQLIQAGFVPDKVTSFYVNPPGQHAAYPIGGDRYQSPDTEEEPSKNTRFKEAMIEVTEAVIGADAHTAHEKAHAAEHSAVEHAHTLRLRAAGMLVAVELIDPTYQEQAIAVFKQLGANHIEKAEGEISDSEWFDFDPLSEPCYL